MPLFIAMIVLERPDLPDPERMKAVFGGAASDVESRDGVVSLKLENIALNCCLIAAPIPLAELGPILRTSPFWRRDDAAISAHQAHLIVTAAGEVDKKQLALILTRVTAGFLRSTESSIAVYWGAGSVVTEKEIFCEFSDAATIDQLPLYLWISFRCYPERNGHGLFTQGMQSLGLMEIEVSYSTESPNDLVGLTFNIAHYLLDHGAVLKHGDTIGMSAEQKLKITHVPSAHDRKEKVYHIAME